MNPKDVTTQTVKGDTTTGGHEYQLLASDGSSPSSIGAGKFVVMDRTASVPVLVVDASGVISGNGSGLTGLASSSIAAGALPSNVTVPPANLSAGALPSNVTVAASNLTTGTVPAARLGGPAVPDADAATITLNLATGDLHVVTLANTGRTLALTGDHNGQRFDVVIVQGGPGTNAVNWWAGVSWKAGTPPVLSTDVGKRDWFRFCRVGDADYFGEVVALDMLVPTP